MNAIKAWFWTVIHHIYSSRNSIYIVEGAHTAQNNFFYSTQLATNNKKTLRVSWSNQVEGTLNRLIVQSLEKHVALNVITTVAVFHKFTFSFSL